MTSQLETVSAAARDDAECSGDRARAIEEELVAARAAAQREAAAAADSVREAAGSAEAAERLVRRVESLESELVEAQGNLASSR
jgi:hypothetical protein